MYGDDMALVAPSIKGLQSKVMYFGRRHDHGRTRHIFIEVAAGFPSCSTPSGGHPQAGLSAALGVAPPKAATDCKFTMNSYF